MKINYLSSSIIPSQDANSVHVMKMCQAFAKNGHKVTLYARTSKNESNSIYNDYGVENCFSIQKSWWPNLRGFGGIIYGLLNTQKIKKNNKADIYYGRDIYSLVALSNFKDSPIYYEAHKPPTSKLTFFIEKKLFSSKNFKKLIVITNALKVKYLELFPNLHENQIIVAPDGADVPKEQQEINSRNIKNKAVCYIGHLYPGKGMEVIDKVSKRLPDITFHIVGGKKEDINYWKNKMEQKNIVFHGYVSNGELYKFYDDFNIFLAPYQKKVSPAGNKGDISKWMSPLKIFEYMSYRKMIIASDLPVIKEVLTHNSNSFLCDPNDTDSWVKTINFLVNNQEKGEKIAAQAFYDFKMNYTWKQRGKNVIS